MGHQSPSHFVVPLTFPATSSLRVDQKETCETIRISERGLAKAYPTILKYWGTSKAVQDTEIHTLVLGCKDGTLYVFHRLPTPSPNVIGLEPGPPENDKSSRPRNISKSSNSNTISPPASSSALSPTFTFNVTSKLRVVSGVTTEQVEAPKNYVDFEDEPDKLKDILKGRNPRERHDSSSDRTPKSTTSSIIDPAPKRKNPASRSLLSAGNSRAPTPPFSAPASPKEHDSFSSPGPAYRWELLYHVIPSRSGFEHSVKSIQFLDDGRFFAVLQETGDLYVFLSEDGTCLVSIHAGDESFNHIPDPKEMSKSRDTWEWCGLFVSYVEESTILAVTAATDVSTSASTPDADEGCFETSRCVIFEFFSSLSDVRLVKLGQGDFNGPATGLGILTREDSTPSFFSIDHNGHFVTYEFDLRPPPIPVPANQSNSTTTSEVDHHHTTHLPTLPILNSFKSIMSRSTEHLLPLNETNDHANGKSSKSILADPSDVGVLLTDPTLAGLNFRHRQDGTIRGLAWAHRELTVFEYREHSLSVLFHLPIADIRHAGWLDHDSYAISFEERVEVYRIKHVNADNEDDPSEHEDTRRHPRPELICMLDVGQHDCIAFSGRKEVLITRLPEGGRQLQVVAFPITENINMDPRGPTNNKPTSQVVWQTDNDDHKGPPKVVLTSTLPLELDSIIQGYSDGRIRQFSVAQIARESDSPDLLTSSSLKTSDPPLNGPIGGLHVVQNPRTREKYIVGGADDGSIAFWSMSTFVLAARWTMFTTPLSKVVQFPGVDAGPLRGCILCISRDGTIATIVIDGFQFLHIIPGSSALLKRICLGGHNLLLIYDDQRARLWDIRTKELWRSMRLEKAEELITQGGWSDIVLERDACVPETLWTTVADSFEGPDAAASLSFDLERFVIDSIAVTKTISTSIDEVRKIFLILDKLRLVLSILITPGLNADVDSICYGKLSVFPSSAVVGLSSIKATTLYQTRCPQDIWSISPNVSAARALAIISVLRAMSLFEELTEGTNTIISFYSSSLASCVGPRFKPPSLEYLARRWFEASNELRHAIRVLFDARVANLSDEEAITITEKWQHHVPALQPDAEKETLNAALALFVCGCVASEKYALLSTNALTDISKSIALYLHDEKSIYRVLAVDLCSRGFHVWQHYIDSMEILRSLINLATNMRKDSITTQNVGAQARLAVLAIAGNSMPLLMGTMCLDILTPPSVEHRRSVLQTLAFLIRKRPHVLQPSLPRLMEAVVKSLDPNSTSSRELVLDTATEIIGYVVKTFPTVDFHMATQRLAVGTNEGAVVMYDLKTAIRLYVLEGHTKPITACSFSTDGRRLVTISLGESLVLVWKVGSSFASFFNPGAPPRQGHGGSQPFKTLNFNVGTDGNMTTAETLDLIRVEWIADRSVKVKIRQSVLTFST